MTSRTRQPWRIGRWSALLLLTTHLDPGEVAVPAPERAETPAALESVRFEGNERIPESALLEVAGLRPGEPVTPSALRRAVEGLARYPYVAIDGPPEIRTSAAGGIQVVFRVRERPVLRDARFEGNSRIPAAELLEVAGLRAGLPLDRETLRAAEGAILRHYHEEGYLMATARLSPEAIAPGRADLVVTVFEGDRVSIEEIEVEGAEAIPAAEILSRLEMEPRKLWGLLSRGYYLPEKLPEELDRIERYYRSVGFLSAVVGFGGLELAPNLREARVRLRVREGPRYVVSSFRVEGGDLFPRRRLEEAARLPLGAFYAEAEVAAARGRIRDWYRGHSDRLPAIRDTIEYLEGDRVAVVFEVEDEKYVRTGEVRIRGNRVTKDRVIRSHLTIIPGEDFDEDEIESTLDRLERLGYFEQVRIGLQERPDPADPEVVLTDVDVEVVERERYGRLLEVGGGASSGAGAVGYVGVHRTNFDLFRLPRSWSDLDKAFTGGGQSLDFTLVPGTRESEYQFRFEEPYLFRSDLSLRLDAGIGIFDRSEYRESRLGGSATLSKFLDRRHRASASLSYVGEVVDIDRLNALSPPDAIAVRGKALLSYPRLSLRYDDLERNDYSGPTGLLAAAHADLSDRAFGSDFDFVRATAALDGFLHLFDDRPDYRHVLHLGLRARWMDGLGGSDVPLYERFYLGGPSSFRGFEYRRLGPHQGDTPVGGNVGIHGTVEYSFPLFLKEVRAVALFDWGDLEPSVSDLSLKRFRTAVGGGLALRLEVLGQMIPANLYWTQALTSERGDRTRLFSFTLGWSF